MIGLFPSPLAGEGGSRLGRETGEGYGSAWVVPGGDSPLTPVPSPARGEGRGDILRERRMA